MAANAYLGSNKLTKNFIGSTNIKKIFAGSALVFAAAAGIPNKPKFTYSQTTTNFSAVLGTNNLYELACYNGYLYGLPSHTSFNNPWKIAKINLSNNAVSLINTNLSINTSDALRITLGGVLNGNKIAATPRHGRTCFYYNIDTNTAYESTNTLSSHDNTNGCAIIDENRIFGLPRDFSNISSQYNFSTNYNTIVSKGADLRNCCHINNLTGDNSLFFGASHYSNVVSVQGINANTTTIVGNYLGNSGEVCVVWDGNNYAYLFTSSRIYRLSYTDSSTYTLTNLMANPGGPGYHKAHYINGTIILFTATKIFCFDASNMSSYTTQEVTVKNVFMYGENEFRLNIDYQIIGSDLIIYNGVSNGVWYKQVLSLNGTF